MVGDQKKRSIEDVLPAVENALARIKPKDASMWAVVQSSRQLIREKRNEGASWAEISAAFREAGFPTATESNVRLAYKSSSEPLKKVTKARRRRESQRAQPAAPAATDAQPPSESESRLLGAQPRTLKSRY